MSDFGPMRKVLNAILPKGSAWTPVIGGGYDGLLEGLADNLEQAQSFIASLAAVRSPAATTSLSDLEREFGVLTDTALSDSERRDYLGAIVYPPASTGSADNLQARLDAAGFNVFVWPNDPAIDPALLLFNEYATWCGETEGVCGNSAAFCGLEGGELLVNGHQYEQFPDYAAICGHASTVCFNSEAVCGYFEGLLRTEITYQIPTGSERWNFIFFVGGSASRWESFIDWNMEHAGTSAWTDHGNAVLEKSGLFKQSGIRSLRIDANGADVDEQQIWPEYTDPDLLAFYRTRLINVTWGESSYKKLENLAYQNELIDGNMEIPDVVTGWSAQNSATLTKETTDPDSGDRCLRVAYNGTNNPYASANDKNGCSLSLIKSITYRVIGSARSDGSIAPQIHDQSLGVLWTGTTSTDWQPFDVEFTPTAASSLWLYTAASGAGYCEFDSMALYRLAAGAEIEGYDATITGSNVSDEIVPWFRGLDYDGIDAYAETQFDVVVNGTFNGATGWTLGTGWSIAANKADKAAGTASLLHQTKNYDIRNGHRYRVTFVISSYVAGTATPLIGGAPGTARSANGTFTEIITAASARDVAISADAAADYQIDNLQVELIPDWFEYENITVETWAKWEDVTNVQGFFANGNTGASSQRLYIDSGLLKWEYVQVATGTPVNVSDTITVDDLYHHIAATRSFDGVNTTIALYIDGVLVDSDTRAAVPTVTTADMLLSIVDPAGGLGFFNGIECSHYAVYSAAKSANWVLDQYNAGYDVLLAGPSAGQILTTPITGSRPLSAAAWDYAVSGTASYCLLMIRNASGTWELAYFNGVYASSAKQSIEYDLTDGIVEARMFCKFCDHGYTFWDDLKVFDPIIERAQVKYAMKDKFERLILQNKPMHSWAGLLIDYV